MKLPVQTLGGDTAGDFEVKFEVIEDNKGQQAVHDTVVAYRAGQRRGTEHGALVRGAIPTDADAVPPDQQTQAAEHDAARADDG